MPMPCPRTHTMCLALLSLALWVGSWLDLPATSSWRRSLWGAFVASQWYRFFRYAKPGKFEMKLKVKPGMPTGASEALNPEGFL